MKRILTIIGARPQFIKHAPLLEKLSKYFSTCTLHTGQHYDKTMSDVFFRDLGMDEPDINLSIGSHTQAKQTALMMSGIEKVLLSEHFDCVIVYGDTNSTIAGALVSAKLGVKTAHIEAGMRSNNRDMPEEINRIVTDHLSDFNFAPSPDAAANLKRENLDYVVTGDIMFEAFRKFSNKAKERDISVITGIDSDYYLLTLHRQFNTMPDNLKTIIEKLASVQHDIVFPIHPRTRKIISEIYPDNYCPDNIHMIEPVGYIDMLALIHKCNGVITDSGGLQKEAYYAEKKCITLRKETEWTETLHSGANILCPLADCSIDKFLSDKENGSFKPLYSDLEASTIITQYLRENL
ncbi:MAG: UDP-N-acetylglucosamine 2-epimerase (non-hydrolyzing) [candidate division WOR-3 bacterium]|nr:UDP-N-acetylglucosamine 2-epimerase (non-hydrolyzing) [candidate division WOR-3 bacterium]